jgi:lipopolysaccharide/colanic/teichoic acid biosynthesis glycosyltransferase
MKRVLDLVIVLATAPVVVALLGLTALAVAAGRNGPVLFRQVRIGMGQRPFTMYKFRSMYVRSPREMDQLQERVLTSGQDDRLTPIGRVLRATSLDELPQIFNVLRGDMSLVGPRPVLPEQVPAIPAGHLTRFLVRPGVTGWAQVNGRRGLDWLSQLDLDCWYAKSRSLWLDVTILAKTLLVVLKREAVYGDVRSNWRNYLPDTRKP